MVRSVMASDGINQRHISHEPVLIHMATEMHEFVRDVDAGGCTHEQPRDIGGGNQVQYHRSRNRYEYEDD